MKIPSNKIWTQTNRGNIGGILHDTHNVSLVDPTVVELAQKTFALYDTSDDAQFKDIQAIVYYDGDYIAVTEGKPFTFDLIGSTPVELTGGPNVSTNSDGIVYNDRVYVTTNDNLEYFDGNPTWQAGLAPLTADVPHPMALFDSKSSHELCIGNGNKVGRYNTSHSKDSANELILDEQYEVTCIRYRNGYLYVGTRNILGGEARVFIWNGSGNNAQYETPMGASWIFSMEPYSTTVAVVTNSGELSLINGSAKQLLAAFPVYYKDGTQWLIESSPTFGRVHFNGMAVDGEKIKILIDGRISRGFMPEMRSGVWEYSADTGLNHKYSLTTDKQVVDTGLSLADNVITTSAAHNLISGDTVVFNATSGITGIDVQVPYYVDVQGTTTIKLALSLQALADSRYVSMTGTANSGDSLIYTQNTEYYALTCTPGAMIIPSYGESILANSGPDVIFGATINDVSGASRDVLYTVTKSYNRGSFSTQRIYSNNISDNWKELHVFLDGILHSSEEVIIKSRSSFRQSLTNHVLQGVWSSSTKLHSDSSTSDEDDFSAIKIGDEINFVDRKNRGKTVSVLNVERTVSTTVLTTDEAIGATSDVTQFYVENWTSCQTITSIREYEDFVSSLLENTKGSWVQLKIEMRGFNPRVYVLDLSHSVEKSTL